MRRVEAGPLLPFPEGPGLPAPFHVPSHTCSLPDAPAFPWRQPLAGTPPPTPLSRWSGWRKPEVEPGKTWKRLEAREGQSLSVQLEPSMAPRGGPLAGLGRAAEQAPPRTQAGPGLSHRLRASRTDCIASARAWDSSPAEGPEDSPSGLKGWVWSWAREWRRNSAARAGAEVGASLRAPPWRHFRGAQLEFAASMAAKGALSIGVAGQPQGGKQGRGRGASRPRTGELLGARRRRPYNRRRLLKIKTSASRHSDQTTAAAGGRQKPCHRRRWGRFGARRAFQPGRGYDPSPTGPALPHPRKNWQKQSQGPGFQECDVEIQLT